MKENKLKNQFEYVCSGLFKTNECWNYLDRLGDDIKTREYFTPLIEKLIDLLNEDDSILIDMETDDIYDKLCDNMDLKNKHLEEISL